MGLTSPVSSANRTVLTQSSTHVFFARVCLICYFCSRLREEKLERRVKKELPVVTKRLRQQIVDWEAANGQFFLINGSYLKVFDSIRLSPFY